MRSGSAWSLMVLRCAVLGALITIVIQNFTDNHNTLSACKYEDSTNCRWDAHTRGNRDGDSFTAIRVNKLDYVIYDNGIVMVFDNNDNLVDTIRARS